MRARDALGRLVAGALCLAAGCGSCGGGAAEPSPADLERAEREVRALYDAVAARDCAAIGRRLESVASEEDCAELLEEWEHEHVALLEVLDVRRDGRYPDVVLVRTRVRRQGREVTAVVRVTTRSSGGWTMTL